MKKGILIYDSSTNRFDVLYEEGNSYGGLHCGTTMEVLINDEWVPTRIEYGNDWYLVGVQKESLPGLQVPWQVCDHREASSARHGTSDRSAYG